MLSYSVRLSEENIKTQEVIWSEKYVSPDLSFVSGVTSQSYHIDKYKVIPASIGRGTNFATLYLETQNVTRNGYILIKNKEYHILSGETSLVNPSVFHYADVNGVYYYVDGKDTVTVKNWLKEKWRKEGTEYKVDIVEDDVIGTVDLESGILKLDTIVWIENETVTIDGNVYFFDRYDISENSESPGGIKYYEDGESLRPKDITDCETITFNHFDNVSDYLDVTKFKLYKKGDKELEYDKISCCVYFYYVFYKDNYCPINRVVEDGVVRYECKVLKSLLDPYSNSYEYSSTTVHFENDEVPPTRISQLRFSNAYVLINENSYLVQNSVRNANYGDSLAIYLTDEANSINVGDTITISCDSRDNAIPVYEINGQMFIMYDSVKYLVKDSVADVVIVDGVEHSVSYPNGKIDGVDALVDVDGINRPMKIIITMDEDIEKVQLQTYGDIVIDESVTEGMYNVVTYSGVTINDTIYKVVNNYGQQYIVADIPFKNEFVIDSIQGSSLILCSLSFNSFEYDDDFKDKVSNLICEFYSTQTSLNIFSKNRAFGVREITPEIGFIYDSNPNSSNDYYNLFDSFAILANTGYIQLNIPLVMDAANNGMQEDTVNKDFYESEEANCINPIIDMEKDVYIPMYMEGSYSGSETDFFPVTEIEVNMHFRTRDAESWKINDGNSNLEVSGCCDNWFCTDYYPYVKMISGNTEEAEAAANTLLNSSDLVGLLRFDNNDVFYQKNSLAKSFLRFSYYDSPDPNHQSLLCTSTVFVDEHALYKKYIDNSRRNIVDYGIITEPKYTLSENGYEFNEDFSGSTINRVSVFGELLSGGHQSKRSKYIWDEVVIDEKRRISSKFTIKNKYTTDTSSEGFYLYMFREYSEKLHPKPIYMKIEFNHAGIGKTIPLIIPMRWDGDGSEKYPVSPLSLYGNDLEYLKQGYPLSYVYAQSYIPLYAVYDFKNKCYAYVFDDRYINKEELKTSEEKVVKLNLFEIKIMDEKEATINDLVGVRNNDIDRAIIDVNSNQFGDIV